MQKSLCFHVGTSKNGLVRHAITLRTLLDAHSPKEVSEVRKQTVRPKDAQKFFSRLSKSTSSLSYMQFLQYFDVFQR